jgi:hypothetical protein
MTLALGTALASPAAAKTFAIFKETLKDKIHGSSSFEQALEVVSKSGGRVKGNDVLINGGDIRSVRLEVNLPGLRPTEKRELDGNPDRETAIEFEGAGVVVSGQTRKTGPAEPRLSSVLIRGMDRERGSERLARK